jgi:hypothetical protein
MRRVAFWWKRDDGRQTADDGQFVNDIMHATIQRNCAKRRILTQRGNFNAEAQRGRGAEKEFNAKGQRGKDAKGRREEKKR